MWEYLRLMVLALHIKIVSLTGEKWQLNNLRIHQKWMKIDFYHFNIQSRFLTKLFSVGIPLMKCCPELYCLTSRSELGEKGGVRLQNQGGGGWWVFLHPWHVLRTLLTPLSTDSEGLHHSLALHCSVSPPPAAAAISDNLIICVSFQS